MLWAPFTSIVCWSITCCVHERVGHNPLAWLFFDSPARPRPAPTATPTTPRLAVIHPATRCVRPWEESAEDTVIDSLAEPGAATTGAAGGAATAVSSVARGGTVTETDAPPAAT